MPTRTRIGPAPIIITVLVRREITDQSLPDIDEAETPAPSGHSIIIIIILRFRTLLLAYFPSSSNLRADRHSKRKQACREYNSHNFTPYV